MKKWLCILITLCLLLCAVGCASVKEDDGRVTLGADNADRTGADDSLAPSVPSSAASDTEGTAGKTDEAAGSTVPATTAAVESTWVAEEPMFTVAAEAERAPAEESFKASADAVLDASGEMIMPSEPGGSSEIQVGAGMLTAGEWKDLDDIPFWTKLLNDNDWYALMERRTLFSNHIVTVRITDGNGNPCFNVPVTLKDADGKAIYRAVSDVNGKAYLLYNLENNGQAAKSVTVGNADYDITPDGETVITAESAGIRAEQLDLLFMVDTTGSMGDELSYLKAELRDVIRKVAEADRAFAINLSVNFYRDTGDEYVVRSFEFTGDIDKAIEQLSAQSSNGGGDYPEAVHLALEDVVNNHQWRENAVKLCFMVLDAPPHSDSAIPGIDSRLKTAVGKMAELGIRFIPVASSGVDTETEFLLRSWAIMTGGTYTFLTNHSGIGNSHLEPTIGAYEVEKLNDLLVRVISEYCGIS